MKKYFYTLIALATIFTSCNKAIDTYSKSETEDGSIFIATLSNDFGVRTSLSYSDNNTKGKVYWDANDQIAVNKIVYTTTDGGSTATFETTGEIPMPPYHGFYPSTIAQTGNRFYYPTANGGKTVNFEPGKADNLPMYAYSDSGSSLKFHNLFGVLELTLPDNINVSSIKVQTGSKFLTGIFVVDTTTFEVTKYTGDYGVTSGDHELIINCNNQSSTGTKFLVALPPATYDYLTITVCTSVNDQESIVLSRTKHNVTITQNEIKPITLTELFYIEAVDAGAVIGFERQTNAAAAGSVQLECSTDATTWKPFIDASANIYPQTLQNAGDRLYVRCAGTDRTNASFGNETEANCSVYKFVIDTTAKKKVKVGGNIMYLLNQSGSASMGDRTFSYLFQNTSVSDASELILPYVTARLCYRAMFEGCRYLTAAPALPAKTASESCYQLMFFACGELTSAPSLPATTIANYCYDAMFQGCNKLTDISKITTLPATTLADHCYSSMFAGCNISSAPSLPATQLANNCYYQMFLDCPMLSSVTMLATNVKAKDCLTDWLKNAGTSLEPNQIHALRVSNNISNITSDPGLTIANNTPTNWSIYNDTNNEMQLNPLGYGNKPLTNN